jgi:hypothetical protein
MCLEDRYSRVALARSIAEAKRALAELDERRRQIEQSLRDQELALASLDAAREQPPSHADIAAEGVRTSVEKIALFRQLFRGREDVYPRAWANARTRAIRYEPHEPAAVATREES